MSSARSCFADPLGFFPLENNLEVFNAPSVHYWIRNPMARPRFDSLHRESAPQPMLAPAAQASAISDPAAAMIRDKVNP